MPATKQPSLSALFAKMTAIFQKADPDQIADLNDSLENMSDARIAGDIFNAPASALTNQRANPTGPAEPMSGSGVGKMVSEYSQSAPQSLAGGAFAEIGDRLASLKSACKAILQHVFKSEDVTDEDRFNGDEEPEEDKDEASSKAADISTLSVNDALSLMLNRATKAAERAAAKAAARDLNRSANPGGPPNFAKSAAVVKSAYAQMQERLDYDPSISTAESLDMRIRMNAQRLMAEGGIQIDRHDPRLIGNGLASRVNPVAARY